MRVTTHYVCQNSHPSITVREVPWDIHGRVKHNVYRNSDNRYMGQIWAHNPPHAVIGFVKDRELRPDAVNLYSAKVAEAQNLDPNMVVAL
jgi:hypothetical protein